MSKLVGVVPARMAASRFPGKPLHPIFGRPLLEHCFERAKLFEGWDYLMLATCDAEIEAFGLEKGYPVVMTSDKHTRALDRVAEAVTTLDDIEDDDIVVCVQGDEPLLSPDIIEAVIKPFNEDDAVPGTMLAVPIVDEDTFVNPDIVKLVHNRKGDVLYTSRSPIPYAKDGFTPELGAMRVGGIFGFRWSFLRWFTETPESPLEQVEACDSNRICDNGFFQRIAPIAWRPYVSVDSPHDVTMVEAVMKDDPLWGRY